ncbi:MAG: low temperature requirement protein A [Potamolinea sp.]
MGLFVDFATPLSASKLQVQLPPHASHLPERMGLFTLIVLGESIIAVVSGVAEQKWNFMSAIAKRCCEAQIAGVCGMSIAFSLWWMYFENIGGSAIRISRVTGHMGAFQTWFYAHLPLMIGIAATGVGVEHIVSVNPTKAMPDAERWLLCGSVALCLLALALLHLTKVTLLSIPSFPPHFRSSCACCACCFWCGFVTSNADCFCGYSLYPTSHP